MKNLLLAFCLLAVTALSAQQPQTSTNPIYRVNAQVANGTAPGYWPTAGAGLTLNISAGTAFCNGSIVTYVAGTLSMTDATTNRVYLNTSSSCVPAVKTAAYATADIPIATVVASGGAITTIADNRTFQVSPSTGAGSGTVTSASFTGGLISVANPTTTPALTVAGTSGGVPYFNSASTWLSSGALTANLPMIGGGAGASPAVGTRSGNTTKFVSMDGSSPATDDCAKWDANDNLTTAGAACGGGGSGYATVDNEDTPLTQRTTVNFVGAGINCADDTTQTTCTISGGGGATDDSDVAVDITDTGSVATTQHEINEDRPIMPIDFGGRTCADVQQAIDALPSTGGIVYIPEGTYACGTTTLTVAAGKNGVHLYCASPHSTVFTFGAVTTRAILVGATSAITEHFMMSNCKLDVSATSGTLRVFEGVRPWYFLFFNVSIAGQSGNAAPLCQTAFYMNGGSSGQWGNYNFWFHNKISGDFVAGWHFDGNQPGGDSMNSNTIDGGSVVMNAASKANAACTTTPSGRSVGVFIEHGQQNFVRGLDRENFYYGDLVYNHDNELNGRWEGTTVPWRTETTANGTIVSGAFTTAFENAGTNTRYRIYANGGSYIGLEQRLTATADVGESALIVPDGRYLQSTDNNAGAPTAGDCDNDSEYGRFSIDVSNERLYICNGAARGWDYVALTD